MNFPLLSSSYFLLAFFILEHSVRSLNVAAFYTTETDGEALLEIKNQIDDPLQALSSWNDSVSICNWHGITCDLRHQRVTSLNLSSLGLTGALSPHIGNLSFLRQINIQVNNFHGTIPQEVGRLFRLQTLRLANNSFHGEIPINLTHCSDLQIIDLTGNQLKGNIPAELGSLSKLYELSVGKNNLTGKIPSFIGNLSSLQILGLSRNFLDGSIPVEFGQLSELYSLQLSSNKLSGIVPPQLYNISSMQIISVPNNQLSGQFPPNLGLTLPKLNLFLVSSNQFSGSIPATLANASGLVRISIGDNHLTGLIPRNLGSLQNLQVLHLAGNPLGIDKANDISFISSLTNCSSLRVLSLSRLQIGGVLANSIGNFSSNLTSVWLDQNYISGSIPPEIGNLEGLSYLTIDTNMLTGSIPDSIGKLTNMQQLYFFINKLSGNIPSSIGNITGLSILILEDNMLEGSIPASLGNCRELQGLHLALNRLNGSIPEQVFSLSALSIGLILGQNQLSGSLPSEVGNLKSLAILDISRNKLSGKIPSSLGDCLTLDSLTLEGNFFEGTIPSTLGQLRGISVIDLSRNNLSGKIPDTLGKLKLITNLNLSFNMLEGEVPSEGVFTNLSEFSILGNQKLCGGMKSLGLPACPTPPPTRHQKVSAHTRLILATTIPLSIILLLATVLAIWKIRRSSSLKRSHSTASAEDYLHPKFSYTDISRSTDGFSSEYLIGEGKYGSVYKGFFRSGEQILAVKVLKLQEHGASKTFLAECEALRNLRHRNLVKIITSCSSIDSEGNDFKALVFEFMPYGNLETWLHSNSTDKQAMKKLSLIQRLDIATDVAYALDYLHNGCGAPVIHCDLKPSNVLIGDDFCAKVSDFGLARFLSAIKDKTSHTQSSSLGLRGTIRYVAPEYGMGGEVSTKGDVYSYGILLLEMLTGKRPTNSMFTDENFSLHNYVEMAVPHRVMEIVDQEILSQTEDEPSFNNGPDGKGRIVRIKECLVVMLQIGVSCSAEVPRDRMDINDVLTKLHTVRNLLLDD